MYPMKVELDTHKFKIMRAMCVHSDPAWALGQARRFSCIVRLF